MKKLFFPLLFMVLDAIGHYLYEDYIGPWTRHSQSNPTSVEEEIEKFINCLNRE